MIFDKDLNWKPHIDYVCQKVSKSCGSLVKLRNLVDVETLREVYHALIHSYLRYGIIVWGDAAHSVLKPLCTIINRAIRIMCFAPQGNIDVNHLFQILEILRIDDVYALEISKFMYKLTNNLLPISYNHFSTRETPQHRYNLRARTRSAESQVIHRTMFGKKSIQIRGANAWDHIPDEIRKSETLNVF